MHDSISCRTDDSALKCCYKDAAKRRGRLPAQRGEENIMDPLTHQEGGSHYKNKTLQPIEYIMANGLGFCEGNVVKYVTRYKDKNGLEDLKKARHYIDFLIEDQERRMNIQEGTHG